MSVKIRLKRLGKIRAPYYRIVVADSRTKRDGRVIEEIGKYHPTEEPSFIEIDSARAQYWLGVGAQPTEQVTALLKLSGDWGTFKGEKGAKSTIRTKAEPEPFVADEKKKPVLKPKCEKPKAEPKAEAPAAEAPAAEAPAAEVEAPRRGGRRRGSRPRRPPPRRLRRRGGSPPRSPPPRRLAAEDARRRDPGRDRHRG